MKRKDSECSQWFTDEDRPLLQLNRWAEPGKLFTLIVCNVSRDELKQLGETIDDALAITKDDENDE